jgi:tyrosine-protein kinase Etk/Wzc
MTPRRPDVAFELLDGTGPSSHPPLAALPPPDPEPDEVSLSEYLDVLVQGRWLVAAALALALAGGGAYALLATPIYRSDALVQVEDAKATKGLLGDLSSAFGESSPSETEIEILRSRALVGAVVKELASLNPARLVAIVSPRRSSGGAKAIEWSKKSIDPSSSL